MYESKLKIISEIQTHKMNYNPFGR